MPQPVDPDALRAKALDVLAQMQQFNVTHTTATFTEIEDAVEAALAGLRQDLLTQSLQGQELADFRAAPERPVCPVCGAAGYRPKAPTGGHAGGRGGDHRAHPGTLLSLRARAFPPWMSN